jgi:hypothetical protein
MVHFEPWAVALIATGGTIFGIFLFKVLVQWYARRYYRWIKENPRTKIDIDDFVGPKYPPNYIKIAAGHAFQIGSRKASHEPIPLEVAPSPHVEGLQIVSKRGKSDSKDAVPLEDFLKDNKSKQPILIATIRMGFGHHRLAYSAASWCLKNGHPAIFHDFLNVESSEADLVSDTDAMYSRFSRMATEIGGPFEKLWGACTLSGDADALRLAAATAAHLQPLLLSYPKDIPLITTHQLTALTAAAIGFTNIVNLVVDNRPQWFLTVPKSLNIVQGPKNYETYLRMGIQPKELAWAGHWCPADMVDNIDEDCKRRIERANNRKQKPLRLLIPVGGAGAQKTYIMAFLKELAPFVKDGKAQLFLNAGDHEHMKEAFEKTLDESGLDFDVVKTSEGVREFQSKLLDGKSEPKKAVTLFAFDDYFPAVCTTDILSRVCDVLAAKPSELAFYAVPKLNIRRVGDHEADSATRSNEMGDGTLEAREVEDAIEYVELFMNGPELLVNMNECIMRNHHSGLYNGTKNAYKFVMNEKDSTPDLVDQK